jgi:cytochrome c oxidase cbb3-type subunit 1
LTYSFVESVKSTAPFYLIRLLGGVLYLGGMLLMAYNVIRTVQGQAAVNPAVPSAVESISQSASLAKA